MKHKSLKRRISFVMRANNYNTPCRILRTNLDRNASNRWMNCFQRSGPYFTIRSKFSRLQSNHGFIISTRTSILQACMLKQVSNAYDCLMVGILLLAVILLKKSMIHRLRWARKKTKNNLNSLSSLTSEYHS
jgi:hypothetical protein